MKNKNLFSLVLVFIVFLLCSCQKENKVYDAYFYTSDTTASGKVLLLYLDGIQQDTLPLLSIKPTFSDDSLLQKTIHIPLDEGKYEILVKDEKNTEFASATFKFHSNFLGESTETSGGTGGVEIRSDNEVILIDLFNQPK